MKQPSAADAPVRVWDLPTRIFHWVLAATVVCSVISAKIGGNAMAWHFRFGYLVLTLVSFRVLWGFVGGRWSRFASFLYSPASVLRYLRGQPQGAARVDVGHSPLGSLSVFALLAFLLFQVGTGLVADDEISNTGPLNRLVSGTTASVATGYHTDVGQWVLIALVLLHIGAVLYYLLRQHNNLIGPMWHGDKTLPANVPASADSIGTRVLAAALVLICAAAVGWLVSLGG
jgi:cytochrome b